MIRESNSSPLNDSLLDLSSAQLFWMVLFGLSEAAAFTLLALAYCYGDPAINSFFGFMSIVWAFLVDKFIFSQVYSSV